MKLLLAGHFFSLFASLASTVSANAEKAVFRAPPARPFPPSLESLRLETITPDNPSLRKALPVAFPTETGVDRRTGETSWYFLPNLTPNQNYELRVCWAATQPSEFRLDTYSPADIVEDPALQRALLQYEQTTTGISPPFVKLDHNASHLFLRVISTADFYTTDRNLMQYPPPVDVDLILDPYLANIFPRSLLPTAAYILALALISWPLSRFIWSHLSADAPESKTKSHTE